MFDVELYATHAGVDARRLRTVRRVASPVAHRVRGTLHRLGNISTIAGATRLLRSGATIVAVMKTPIDEESRTLY